MKELIANFAALFYDAQKNPKNKNIQEVLSEVFEHLKTMYERIENGKTEIVFIGKSNNGKSTLLNALFQENIAPRKNGPYTAAIVEYRSGEKYSIVLQNANQKLANIVSCDSAEELYEELDAKATVTEDSNFADAQKIIVKMPSDLLRDNVVIYDTPGFGATKGDPEEQDKGLHDDIVCDFFKQKSYDQAFWIFRGDNVSASELEFLQKNITRYSYCCQNHFIINMEDDFDEDDKNKYIKKYLKKLIASPEDVLFINAKKAIMNKDDCLRNYVQSFLKQNKIMQQNNFIDLLNRFIVHCQELENEVPYFACTIMATIKKMIKESNDTRLIDIVEGEGKEIWNH